MLDLYLDFLTFLALCYFSLPLQGSKSCLDMQVVVVCVYVNRSVLCQRELTNCCLRIQTFACRMSWSMYYMKKRGTNGLGLFFLLWFLTYWVFFLTLKLHYSFNGICTDPLFTLFLTEASNILPCHIFNTVLEF